VIRFAWMQSRIALLIAAAGLAIVTVILGTTGPHLLHLYDTTVGACHSDCSATRTAFLKNDRALHVGLDALVVVVPGVIGLFWGAPLVAREFETGTWRLVFTQSVTRTRWLGVKLLLGALASMAAAGLLSLLITWWSSPIDQANATLYTSFEQRNIVPIGYAAFAFALAVLVGVLVRKTVPAMAVSLGAFVGARLVFTHWVRPHLISPVTGSFGLNATTVTGVAPTAYGTSFLPGSPSLPNAWIYSTKIVDNTGHPLTSAALKALCPQLNLGAGPRGGARTTAPYPYQDCIPRVAVKFHEVVVYQPSSHYWPLQWTELAVYLGIAILLIGISLWATARRTT
jgi:ABC-type transport system involved in multi-copper enzyme maturation permease subunit